MKKNKKRNNNSKPTYFTRVIDFILEIIGSILLFFLETSSNDKNESKDESNKPKLEMFCPRCLGKGFVDSNDIKRLGQERTWHPDKCGYCKGNGYVERGSVKYRDPRTGETSSYSW